jgi:magnesium chelatase subunit I
LKDRIGSQILTHYPETIEIAKIITTQEAKLDENQSSLVHVPNLAKDLLEQVGFEARESEYIDTKSGVSARMSITAYENLISTAERRALLNGEEKTTVRLSDFLGIIPAITGKVELVYEGEQEGAGVVAQYLIANAIHTFFPGYFPKIEKLEKQDVTTPYTEITEWFFNESGFELTDDCSDEVYKNILDEVQPLEKLIQKYQPEIPVIDQYFLKEFILWALVEYKKLSKERTEDGFQFKDPYSKFISKLS